MNYQALSRMVSGAGTQRPGLAGSAGQLSSGTGGAGSGFSERAVAAAVRERAAAQFNQYLAELFAAATLDRADEGIGANKRPRAETSGNVAHDGN